MRNAIVFLLLRDFIGTGRLRFSFHQYAVGRITNPHADRNSNSHAKPNANRSGRIPRHHLFRTGPHSFADRRHHRGYHRK